jgi:fluoride exporter
MGLFGFVSVGVGATLGAWLRWWLGAALNAVLPTLAVGTLAANLIGGYLVGLAIGYFEHIHNVAPETRLFITTGFLGGLTTFSAFSGETTTLLLRAEYLWAAINIGANLIGSLLLTLLGVGTILLLRSWLESHG